MTILIKRDEPETRFRKKMNSLEWLIWLLFAMCLVSCSSEETEIATQADTYINLQVSAPSSRAESQASSSTQGKDEVAANPTEEEKIYSIRVWAYATGSGDDAAPIGYTEQTDIKDASGSTSVSMKILRNFAEQQDQKLDLYILLNAESIDKATVVDGQSNKMLTRSQLASVKISDTGFGFNDSKPSATEVPTTGLPISRIVTNIDVQSYVKSTETEAASNPIKVKLVRAVSKLHFYFARKAKANTDQVQVTKIEINGNFLPTESPVFPKASQYDANETSGGQIIADYTNWNSYEKSGTIQVSNGIETKDIKEVDNPITYIKSTEETAQDYVDRLSKDGLVEKNRCYFRESNQKISGTIYYKLDNSSAELSQTFTINTEAYRNYDMLVYGYFLEGGSLCLDWQVLPWSVQTSEVGWKASCQMFAWTTKTPSATKGDAEGVYCLVCYPRYAEGDDEHNSLEDKKSGAAFYIKVDGPTGLIWKAHLTNTEDFEFNYGKSTNTTNCVSTGIARTAPYQIKVQATHQWTSNASWDTLTDWAKDKDDYKNPVYTDLYVTVSLDGIHEYEVEINPDNAKGKYQNSRKFAGTNTRIRIYQLKATKGTAYDKLQKNSGLYTNYLTK